MDSNLNITIRVTGRQAQAQLRAVSKELEQMQSTALKGQKISAASVAPRSAWSPAIAAKKAKEAERAVTAAVRQAERERLQIKREATAAHNQLMRRKEMSERKAEREAIQLARHEAREKEAIAKKSLKEQETAARAHKKRMDALGSGGPISFAKNLSSNALVNAGKNIGWVGRQLTYNFTLPLAAAGTMLFKFNQDITRSMTNMSKLYGQAGEDQKMLDAEVNALARTFELLSTRFGVNQAEVIDIGAAWAAAGSEGVAVAKNTRATLETMILYNMDAAQATEALIAIQAQWHFSTQENADGVSELTTQLAYLNAIENATAISAEGLLDVIQRAGGVARTSGMSLRELGAFAAALVPATGDAAQAGTAMRSIISSLVAPTQQAIDALGLMGITVTDPSWMGATVTNKLLIMAQHFDKLSDAQKGVISSTVATRWQVSRFDVLMRDILDPLGNYNKALDVTSNATDALALRNKELMAVLNSSPKKWDIMTNATKNALAKAFIPMMPVIMTLVGWITKLAIAFENLSPETQKWILLGLSMLAVLGPLMVMLGSVMQAMGTFHSGLKTLGGGMIKLIEKAIIPLIKNLGRLGLAFIETAAKAVASFFAATWEIWAVVAVIAAIVGIVVLILKTDFEDPIVDVIETIGRFFMRLPKYMGDAFAAVVTAVAPIVESFLNFLRENLGEEVWSAVTSVAKAFWELPETIGNALVAVARTIWHVMEEIVDALSYLNPFARHSPSLVENVTAGVSTILDQYSRLDNIPGLIRNASEALVNFGRATNAQGVSFREADLQQKADESGAANPQAQGAANALVQQILALESALPTLEQEIAKQELVVQEWANALKAADVQIDMMEENLSNLQREYDGLGDQIAAANKRIGELVDTPIEGMTALGDAIFENELAQNKLNMELLQFEKQGMTLDSIRDKYAAMAGEIETLRGTQEELRGAGAGSDILSWYDDQIAGIQDQKKEMGGVEQQILDIQNQLDALDLEGRFLELTKAINFDPLERQLDKIANKVTEMPFDEIVRQIREQQAIVEELTPKYDAIGKEIEQEKEAIDAAKLAREGIKTQLDTEEEKLSALKDAYSDIKNLIGDMESALNDFARSAKEAADEASRLEELFAAGEGLDFPDVGGTGGLGREGGLPEIEQFNADLDQEIADALGDMGLGDLDFIAPLKAAWEKAVKWFKENWAIILAGALTVGGGLLFGPLGAAIGAAIGALIVVFVKWGPQIWKWTNEHIVQPVWQAIQTGWDKVVAVWNALWDPLIKPIIDFAVSVAKFLWPIIQTVARVLVQVAGVIIRTIMRVIKWLQVWVPKIAGIIKNVFVTAYRIVSRVLTTIWNVVSTVFTTIWEIIQGAWDVIVAAFRIGAAIVGAIMDVIVGVIRVAIDVIMAVFNFLAPIVVAVWNVIVAAFKVAWVVIGPILNLMWSIFKGYIIPIFQLFFVVAEIIVVAVVKLFQFLWSHLDEIFGFIWAVIHWVITDGFEFLANVVGTVFSAIGTAIMWAWENVISPVFNFIWGVISWIVTDGFPWLQSVVSTVFTAVGDAIMWVWEHVISPVFNWIAGFINDTVVPAFHWLWERGTDLFNMLGDAVMWVWDHILSPVFNWISEFINATVVPAFTWLWQEGERLFDLLGTAMQWTWDNVISPIFNGIDWAIDNVVLPAFQWASDEIGRIWTGIGNGIQWTMDNVISPIWDGFMWAFEHVVQPAFQFLRDDIIVPIMNGIHQAIAYVWNAIATVIEGGVNFFINAFNLVGDAVNAVARFLGIEHSVGHMENIHLDRIDTGPAIPPKTDTPTHGAFAAGGIVPAGGGMFNQTRAIIGEGSNFYPEFVIPTDPSYRGRALNLLDQAGTRLLAAGGVVGNETLADEVTNWTGPSLGGEQQVHGSGGVLGWMGGIMDGLYNMGKDIVQGAIRTIWQGPKFLAQQAIDLIPNQTFKDAGQGILNTVDAWVMGRDTDWNQLAPGYVPKGSAGTGNTGSGASAGGIPITYGSGSWQAFVTLLNSMGIPFINLGTYANRGTKYGTPSMHAQNRAMDFGGTQSQLQAIDHALYDAFKPNLYELIWTGSDARNVYKGQDHTFRTEIANDHRTHVHASMAQGGQFYVPRIPGGVNMNIAEGRSGERVQILPVDGNEGSGTTIVINGNLEFPGIRDGRDAKDFIDNLRALAS